MIIFKKLEEFQERLGDFIEKYYKQLMVVICLVYVGTRLFKLTEIPSGMNFDELGIAYDAFSPIS